jgi:hypothetical protein
MVSSSALTNDSLHRGSVGIQLIADGDYANYNYTWVYWNANVSDGNSSTGGHNASGASWSVSVDGVVVTSAGNKSYDFGDNAVASPYFPRAEDGHVIATHNNDGTGLIGASTAFSYPNGSASTIVWLTLTTFTGPSTPSAPSLSRSSDGSSITINGNTPSLGSASYKNTQWRVSTDNSNWSSENIISSGGTSAGFTANSTTPYYFQTRVNNGVVDAAWMMSGWSSSSYIAGVPSVPSSITPTVAGRTVTVTVGSSATDGGASASYWVRYSVNGGAYSSPVQATGSPLTATFANMAPNANYTFQAYAINSTGASSVNTSSSVYVPSGGKRFDGSSWVAPANVRRWDGGAWVPLTTSKRWSGSAWVDLT